MAVKNDVDLDGVFLLTAPNMSGKSTLMRSILVAALLANCGLFVPCDLALVPRYDHFFLRTASYDIPSESKSAFALEMDDMRVVLRDCTPRSLVMIDELGKGASESLPSFGHLRLIYFMNPLMSIIILSPSSSHPSLPLCHQVLLQETARL